MVRRSFAVTFFREVSKGKFVGFERANGDLGSKCTIMLVLQGRLLWCAMESPWWCATPDTFDRRY